MQETRGAGQQALTDLAQRYGVSLDAVRTLYAAVRAGGGSMAQFSHPDLGGSGQWMRGGMTMVGDMFNSSLQATVSGLCAELSSLRVGDEGEASVSAGADASSQPSSRTWWPAELGSPSSSGGQNDARYAYFPETQRLAIDQGGEISLYDTKDHRIGGVQQQQGSSRSLSFTSQHGTFTVDSLPRVDGKPGAGAHDAASAAAGHHTQARSSSENAPRGGHASGAGSSGGQWQSQSGVGQSQSSDFGRQSERNAQASAPAGASTDVITALERLGKLVESGVLTREEFQAKKAELLARV